MDAARTRLADAPDVVFQRRVITREAMPGAEDHDTLSIEAFEAAQARGDFALSWQAHGLLYGVPREIESRMLDGRTVIVNVSRTVIETACDLYPGTRTIVITASHETLSKRLAARGRETPAEISARLSRNVDAPLPVKGVTRISNDGDLEEAVCRFVEIVAQFASGDELS